MIDRRRRITRIAEDRRAVAMDAAIQGATLKRDYSGRMDFSLLEPRGQQAMRTRPFREWLQPDGSVWLQFYRTDSGYVLRFPEMADFEICAGGSAVRCSPLPGLAEETARHLFLNQVLPLALSKRGKLVFHASAVEVEGVALAFVADSGGGKSTLAASFATNGFRFLCDDGLVLDDAGDGIVALPSDPSIRLWDDSRGALIGAAAQTAPPLAYTDKARLLADEDIAFCDRPRPLRRAYFLGDGSTSNVRLQHLGASEALAEWAQHAFLLDPEEKPLMASHFDRLVALAREGIAYRLDFPRRYVALAEVRRAVVAHIREEERRFEAV